MLVSGKGWGRALFAVQPADLVWSWRSGSDEVRLWCAVYGCTCTRGRVLLEGACVSGIRNTVSGIRNTGPVQVCAILWYVQYLGIHVLQYPQYCTFVSIHMYPCVHAAPGTRQTFGYREAPYSSSDYTEFTEAGDPSAPHQKLLLSATQLDRRQD